MHCSLFVQLHDAVLDKSGSEDGSGPSSVIHDAEGARNNLVVENRACRNVDSRSAVGHNDHRSPQRHALAEPDVPADRQVVELENVRDGGEAGEVRRDAPKVVAELYNRRGGSENLGTAAVDGELAAGEGVQVALDEEEVGCALDGQEARPRHVYAVRALKVACTVAIANGLPDGCTNGGFQLDDLFSRALDLQQQVDRASNLLGIDNDLELQGALAEEPLDGPRADPQVVRVKDLRPFYARPPLSTLKRFIKSVR